MEEEEDFIGKHSVGMVNILLITLNKRVAKSGIFCAVFLKWTNSFAAITQWCCPGHFFSMVYLKQSVQPGVVPFLTCG